MAEMSHVERISEVIDELYDGGTLGFFMGVSIEEFDKERLIKLLHITFENFQRRIEQTQRDYEFLGSLEGLRKG